MFLKSTLKWFRLITRFTEPLGKQKTTMGVCQQCVKLVTVCRLNMRFNRCSRYVVLTLCIEVNFILVAERRKERKEELASEEAAFAHSRKNQTNIRDRPASDAFHWIPCTTRRTRLVCGESRMVENLMKYRWEEKEAFYCLASVIKPMPSSAFPTFCLFTVLES